MAITIQQVKGSFAREACDAQLWQALSDSDIDDLRNAWGAGGVLFFRRQCITEDELAAFSARFGEPEVHPRSEWNSKHNPRIVLITNLRDFEGDELGALGSGELAWHTDQSYMRNPATGAILHGVEVPPGGSPTYFANLKLAYAALDEATKAKIDDCQVVYDYVLRTSGYVGNQPEIDEIRKRFPRVVHPLVNTDPLTGHKALYMDPATMGGIVGWPEDEARSMIDQLIAHATQEQFVYAHHWQTGDVVMWDNGFMLHRRDPLGNEPRLMKRTTVQLPADQHTVPAGDMYQDAA